MGFKKGYCQEAENYHTETISIPIYPTLSKENQEHIIDSIIKLF
jgi:dTDP-4-amino-4,6-dideoxygalactose transaminase